MSRLRRLVALVDALGDDSIEPAAAVFDHLAQWVGEEQLLGAEPRLLSDARLGAASRPAAARALLEALGWERLGDDAAELSALIHSLQLTATNFPARALLLSQDRNTGLCLGVNVLAGDKPGIVGMDEADLAMQKQAKTVLSAFEPQQPAIRWSMAWALEYGGESIGVALRLAALVRFKGQRADPLLAATGAVTDDGRVRRVDGVVAKLQAARDAGIRRVLLPRENEAEAAEAAVADDLQLLLLDHVSEVEAFAALHGWLVQGYALDALEAPEATPPSIEDAQEFIELLLAAPCTPGRAVGLGEGLRFAFGGLAGTGLMCERELVTLTAFADEPPSDGPARAGHVRRPSRRRPT